ncbi:hypothetical protein ACTFIU_000593 [Dictyostelium citrinum]
MSLLSALTSISKPMNTSSISSVSSKNGSGLSMGSNSVACGSCGGNSYPAAGLLAIVDLNFSFFERFQGYPRVNIINIEFINSIDFSSTSKPPSIISKSTLKGKHKEKRDSFLEIQSTKSYS